jgi:4-amino-4-deoxy-L-arabinose transferase-like glycosyltransferase
MRLALNVAAATSYGLFGISEWATALPTFVASLLTLAIVYAIAWLVGGRIAAIVAGVLYAVAPLNILNSSSLLPEVPMALCTTLSILIFLLGQRAVRAQTEVSLCLVSGVVLGGAYLFTSAAYPGGVGHVPDCC